MYFGTDSYPWIRDLPKAERRAALRDVYRSDRRHAWRFLVTIGLLALATVLVNRLSSARLFVQWYPAIAGALFYLYLLWEINVPIYRAAKRHFEAANAQSIDGSTPAEPT
jgi:hypothetical protein